MPTLVGSAGSTYPSVGVNFNFIGGGGGGGTRGFLGRGASRLPCDSVSAFRFLLVVDALVVDASAGTDFLVARFFFAGSLTGAWDLVSRFLLGGALGAGGSGSFGADSLVSFFA